MGSTTTSEMTFAPLALLVVAGVLWFVINRKLFRDAFSPFSLLFVSWVAPLILQAMNLSTLERPWRFDAAALVAWVTFALIGTCLMASRSVRDSRLPEVRQEFEAMRSMLRSPFFLAPFLICFVLTFAIYLYAEFVTNPAGIPLVTVLRDGRLPSSAAHRWGKDSAFAAITGLLFVLTPAAYLAYRANAGRLMRAPLLAIALLFPVFGVLKLSRSDVFVSAVTLVLAASYWHMFGEQRTGRWRLRRYAAIGIVTLAVYYMMMNLRIGEVGLTEVYARFIAFRLPGEGAFHGFAGAVYGYVGLPFENLHRFIEASDGALRPGISALRPLLSIVGYGNLADRLDADVVYPVAVSPAAGAATFLTGVYAEGGKLGAALIPIVYALLLNGLYVRMRARPSLGNVLLYLNFTYPWLWLFFNNGFGVLSFYINAGFVLIASLVLTELRRPRRVAALGPVVP
jgi:hypothetical protein